MDTQRKNITLIGSASGAGAQDPGCADGPYKLQSLPWQRAFNRQHLDANWEAIIEADPTLDRHSSVIKSAVDISRLTFQATRDGKPFCVFGGDHACAAGTWAGVAAALPQPLGLIWIDAHMDSHTPDTSPSGALHGMPLAALLGHGDAGLASIQGPQPTLDPRNVCLLGIRSFEQGESKLLQELGVKMYDIDECNVRGLGTCFQEAVAQVTKNTGKFGVSIDLDAIDPDDAPGVGSPSTGGLRATALRHTLKQLQNKSSLVGVEITELNPHHDIDDKTAHVALQLAVTCYG